jgi:cytosine/adenosine deaminase-related metal-dependent hydrolase
VHGLALDRKAVALLNQRRSAHVVCPTSNQFLFHRSPSSTLLRTLHSVVLGSDSSLTSAGDLLNEISFVRNEIGVDANSVYGMVTTRTAGVLRLRNGEGYIRPGSTADLIAVHDKGLTPAGTVAQLTFDQVELVVLGGRIQLASASLYERLPDSVREGLQPLLIDGIKRWLRAPVDDLLSQARKSIGRDVRLGGKKVDHATIA